MRLLSAIVLILASCSSCLAGDTRGRGSASSYDVHISAGWTMDILGAVKVAVASDYTHSLAKETPLRADVAHPPLSSEGAATRCDAPLDAANLRAFVENDAATAGVDPKLALTILELESNSGARLNSNKGARGPMQLMPGTAAQYGVRDICDPQQNVHGAMLFLKDLTAQFQGNMMLIAAAYNAGPDRVFDARGVPPITETVRYVASVANRYYGLNVFAYRRKRASTRPRLPDPPPEVAANDSPDRSEQQRWIGGSVLYVGGNGNGEAQ